jgi:hypothetical protein
MITCVPYFSKIMQPDDLQIRCDLSPAYDSLSLSIADWNSNGWLLIDMSITQITDVEKGEEQTNLNVYLNKEKAISLKNWLEKAIEIL